MENLRISGIQSDLIWEDREKNLAHFQKKISSLSGKSDLVILPEMFTTGFTMNNAKLWETMEGRTVSWMLELSLSTNLCICGSLIIKDSDHLYNRFVWTTPNGEIFHYDKKHLFNLSFEGDHYTAGTKKQIIEYKGWRICPMVCYDLRFPEWSRNREDYDLLIYVANWPHTRSLHWKTLLRARAIENQCYVAGINRVGDDGNHLTYSGDSMICAYDGSILAEHSQSEMTLNAILSKESLSVFRRKLPFLKDQNW